MKDFVSIITVNYNGEKLLPPFLEGISLIKYPKDKFEVIIVDNNSSDGSIRLIEDNFSWAKLVISEKNLGFGGGNNLGVRNAKGDFLFLVNNDTVVDPDCLTEFVNCFKRQSQKHKIGALSAKLVLMDKYLPIDFEDAYFHDYHYGNPGNTGVNRKPYIIREAGVEVPKERVYLPLNYKQKDRIKLELLVKFPEESLGRVIMVGNSFGREGNPSGRNFEKLELELTGRDVGKFAVDLIQNAGNYVFRDGYGRDRGAVIFRNEQYYEEDSGQYDSEEPVDAFCGAGVFINRKAFEEAGGFDEDFFMYYEDDDLSFRMKEVGWGILYCPGAKIRHIHAASSGEWSNRFIYNVERSRLLFVSKHWPPLLVIWEWLKYIFKDTLAVPVGHLFFLEFRQFLGKLRLRLKVNLSVMPFMIGNLFRRPRLSYSDIKNLY